jgi:uncharacterized protein (TIGR02246 family)
MHYLRAATVAVAGLLVLAGCQKAPADTSADKAALRAMLVEWDTAYNTGDADKIADMYWEDAVLMPPGEPASTGRVAIRASIDAGMTAAKAAGMTLDIAEANILDVSGNLAFDSGSYDVKDASGAVVDSGSYIGVYQKREGKWGYIRDIWNSDRAPPAPAPAAAPAPVPAPDAMAKKK